VHQASCDEEVSEFIEWSECCPLASGACVLMASYLLSYCITSPLHTHHDTETNLIDVVGELVYEA